MFFIGFLIWSYPIPPFTTSIGYTKAYAKPSHSNLSSCYIQIITPYMGQTHIHQKAESSRAAPLLKFDNMVNSNSIFNAKCPEFSIKWYVLLHFSQPFLCIQPFLQPTPTIRFSTSANFCLPILLVHKFLRSPPTLFLSITQQFLTTLFLHRVTSTISTKFFFLRSVILPIHSASRDSVPCSLQGSLLRTDIIAISACSTKIRTGITHLLIPYCSGSEIGVLLVVHSE